MTTTTINWGSHLRSPSFIHSKSIYMKTLQEVRDSPYNIRWKSAPWMRPLNIIVGGCGGTGSPLIYLLARQGHTIHIYDDDKYEDLNMGSQLISPLELDKNKADGLTALIKRMNPEADVISHPERFTANSMGGNVMIGAFDNMASRKLMLQKWYDLQLKKVKEKKGDLKDVNLFMEAGMEAELGIIRTVIGPSGYDRWMKEFVSDDDFEDETVCTMRATAHNSFITAGYMVAILNNHIVNKTAGATQRMVPFRYEYELEFLTNEQQ